MSKVTQGIVYIIDHLAPFDVPSEFELSQFVTAQDSVHLCGIVHRTDDKVAYTSKEFGEFLDMIIGRGAIRNIDYIISITKKDGDVLIVLHTTNKFVSAEDGEGVVYSD